MRLLRFSSISFTVALAVAACGGDDGDHDPYDTFQACYDEHHNVEAFDIQTSIKICCISHPIGGVEENIVCGDTQAACETYVDNEVADADVTLTEITEACAGYLVDREL